MTESKQITLPEQMAIQHHPDYIHITRKWYHPIVWLGLLITLAIIVIAIMKIIATSANAELFDRLFPYLLFGGGAFATYRVIAHILNTTNIFVSKNAIQINHEPVPWFGKKRLDASDIEQLYAKERIEQVKNSTTVHFDVYTIMKDGRHELLLKNLDTEEQATFIEYQIETYLGLRDEHVRGAIHNRHSASDNDNHDAVKIEQRKIQLSDIALPKSFSIQKKSSVMHIDIKWFTWGAAFGLLPSIALLTVGLYNLAIGTGMHPAALMFLSMGIWGIYGTAAYIFNRDEIIVRRGTIEIKYGPFLWPGKKRSEIKDIQQIYTQEESHHVNGHTSISYSVYARTVNGKDIEILSDLLDSDLALYIEQEAEDCLQLDDKYIKGSISRSSFVDPNTPDSD